MPIYKTCQLSQIGTDLVDKFQSEINLIDPNILTEYDTKIKEYLRKEVLKLRDELRDGHQAFVERRRVRLRRLLECEALEHAELIRELGYAIIPTQP